MTSHFCLLSSTLSPLTHQSPAPKNHLVHRPPPPSSSGLGHSPLKAKTVVRVPLGVLHTSFGEIRSSLHFHSWPHPSAPLDLGRPSDAFPCQPADALCVQNAVQN